jgi:nicotinate-nucleotide pyrophosphorylase (carboxylating)
MAPLTPEECLRYARAALAEDIGPGDVTSAATLAPDHAGTASLVARENLVLCGISIAEAAFRSLDPAARIQVLAADGARLSAGQTVLRAEGVARALLAAERVALNYLQHLSGIASLTAAFVAAVDGLGVGILDTRKTTPGLRRLEKYAVCCGGGINHRMGLWDRVLIKDNHLAALAGASPDPITVAVQRARAACPDHVIEVEADTVEQADCAARAGADIILLDNMGLETLRQAVRLVAGRSRTEASGGVTLATVRDIAATGVDFVSVGALTHSAPAVDLALDFEIKP